MSFEEKIKQIFDDAIRDVARHYPFGIMKSTEQENLESLKEDILSIMKGTLDQIRESIAKARKDLVPQKQYYLELTILNAIEKAVLEGEP